MRQNQLCYLEWQNQTIADSNFGLATNLRHQINSQIEASKTDEAIKQYMVERYGEFVLYQPSFNATNAMPWLEPFILLLIGVILTCESLRKMPRAPLCQPSLPSSAPTVA
jgi:cytochrome c-type biogenesis protein CcmH